MPYDFRSNTQRGTPSLTELVMAALQNVPQPQPENYLATNFPQNLATSPEVAATPEQLQQMVEAQQQSASPGGRGGLTSLFNAAASIPSHLPEIGRDIVEQGSIPQETPEPLSPLDQMLQQAMAANQMLLQGQSPYDLNATIAQGTQGLNQIFNPQIGLIRKQSAGAREDTRVGANQIRQMYAALQRNYQRVAKNQAARGEKHVQDLNDIGVRTQNQVNKNAASIINQNAAIGSALGSPELAQELNKPAEQRMQNAANRAASASQRQQALSSNLSANQGRYLGSQGVNVVLEGTNRAADLYSQLQDFLDANRAKIGELAGQKALAIADLTSKLQNSFTDNTSDMQKAYVDNLLEMARIGQADAEAKSKSTDEENPFLKSLSPQVGGPYQTFSTLPPDQGTTASQLFAQLQGDPSVINGVWSDYNGKDDLPLTSPAAVQQMLQANPTLGYSNLPVATQMALTSAILQSIQNR